MSTVIKLVNEYLQTDIHLKFFTSSGIHYRSYCLLKRGRNEEKRKEGQKEGRKSERT